MGSIKKIVHPMPLDSMGRPVFPILLGELTIHSIGEVNTVLPFNISSSFSLLLNEFVFYMFSDHSGSAELSQHA